MKIKVGQNYKFKKKPGIYIKVIEFGSQWVRYKEYKSYKNNIFKKSPSFLSEGESDLTYVTPKNLFLHYYRPINIKVRRIG